MDARGDQDNQDKSDLQGKIQFYQNFYANQHNVERKISKELSAVRPINFSCVTPTNRSRKDFYQFSANLRKWIDELHVTSLDLVNLSSGHHEISHNRSEVKAGASSFYHPTDSVQDRSPNVKARHLDKQSYFFHGHKTEKVVAEIRGERIVAAAAASDRDLGYFRDNKNDLQKRNDDMRKKLWDEENIAGNGDSSLGVIFSQLKVEDSEQGAIGYRKLDRDVSGNYNQSMNPIGYGEFFEIEGVEAGAAAVASEVSKKSSKVYPSNLNDEIKNDFSYQSKEKVHRSLESFDRCPDYFGADAKSLDFVSSKPGKSFFHKKQHSLDSCTQKSKKSNESLKKMNKRPGFFRRVGRSLHFLPKSRDKSRVFFKEDEKNEFLQSGQEKCEYFLQRHECGLNFFDRTLDLSGGKSVDDFVNNSNFFENIEQGVNDAGNDSKIHLFSIECEDLEFNREFITSVDELLNQKLVLNSKLRKISGDLLFTPKGGQIAEVSADPSKPCDLQNSDERDTQSGKITSSEIQFVDQSASVATHETTSGNKDSLEIGYSISQHGRFYLQNLQNTNSDGLKLNEIIDAEKRQHYVDWLARKDLDVLSQGTNSSDSLGNNKPQGNLDILKGILMDFFVCICI